jgi:hypothetical protein
MPLDKRRESLENAYQSLRDSSRDDWPGKSTSDAIKRLVLTSLKFLASDCQLVDLKSMVSGKKYVGFRGNDGRTAVSRPANASLFIPDANKVNSKWENWMNGKLPDSDLSAMAYTVALAPCLAMEIFDRANKKGPATYFEYLIGHLVSKEIGTPPSKQVQVPVREYPSHAVRLTMDFVFNLSDNHRLHLAIKMSSRERVLQAWSHQRILDSAFGVGRYTGLLVVFSETKLDSRSLEVVEICVPNQWLAYQSYLGTLDRIYYFDIPGRYAELTANFPKLIKLRHFGEFFKRTERVEVFQKDEVQSD